MVKKMMKPKAYFYYDIISPYVYFFLKSRKVLEEKLELIPIPIFFPGLLRLQDNRGPAEVAEKRIHTYQFCVWKAQQLKLPFQFPNRHPFASAPAQRLLLQNKADLAMLDKAFDFVWGQGHDPELEWEDFCEAIGLPKNTPKPQDEQIKKALIDTTQTAANHGVFGVPSIRINEQVFWGNDSIDWALEYLNKPEMFSEKEFQRARSVINPLLDK
jgi:2-hydroxychromene-2-carboxylate isomerase